MTVDLISELRALIGVPPAGWNSWNMCLLAFCSFFWFGLPLISFLAFSVGLAVVCSVGVFRRYCKSDLFTD